MKDPTREELIKFLESIYLQITCGDTLHSENNEPDGCGCRFEIEEAAYYIASHYHSGQCSNLYSALSVSKFAPGQFTSELPDDEDRPIASELYRECEGWITGHNERIET